MKCRVCMSNLISIISFSRFIRFKLNFVNVAHMLLAFQLSKKINSNEDFLFNNHSV